MLGASARYSCLHTPVETVTPPNIAMQSAYALYGYIRESCPSFQGSEGGGQM
jgi:hypothetical protein